MTETRHFHWTGPSQMGPDTPIRARRVVDLANLVPAGRWVSPADLAFAYAVRYGKPMTVNEIAADLVPAVFTRVDAWTLPWHRLRLDDGRSITRKYGTVGSVEHLDRMFVDEGGEVLNGRATERRRFELS